MRADIKKYERPTTLIEALQLRSRYGEKAAIIAGGITLHELMEKKLLRDIEVLIDIEKIGLGYIKVEDTRIRIGATYTISDLLHTLSSTSLREVKQLDALYEACRAIKPPQVRNVATVGGEACSGISFLDLPIVLCALNAEFKIRSLRGERYVKAEKFFKSMFTIDIASDEILEEIIIPLEKDAGVFSSFVKYGRVAQDYGLVNAAIMIRFSDENVCEDVRVFFGNITDIPYRAVEVEQILKGRPINEESMKGAVNELPRVEPTPTVHAPPGYKKVLMRVLLKDLIQKILAKKW